MVEALPTDARRLRRGVVFLQPLVAADEAGVAFFDGFYYERAQALGSNEALTSGQARGEVRRGHLARGEAWSSWLASVHAVFGKGARGDPRLDIEFARDRGGYVLLQVRPALFPVQRNPTLSLANHKEILGDPPSPWMVSALVEAGRDLSVPALADHAIRAWGEAYAVEVGERAWLNVSFWFRWMDHFGLPRTLVTDGIGGQAETADDSRLLLGRFLTALPRLLWFQGCCLSMLPGLGRAFRRLDRIIGTARDLAALHQATVAGLTLALRGNFAINAALSAVSRLRRLLRLPGAARVLTQDMMEAYHQLALLPEAARTAALERWLACYGHRGPLESDLARPRFRELREVLRQDVLGATPVSASAPSVPSAPRKAGLAALLRPLYWIDERREWFRDTMMRRWEVLRARLLKQGEQLVTAGVLDAANDVFWLRRSDLQTSIPVREAVAARRGRVESVRRIALPLSAPQDQIEEILRQADTCEAAASGRKVFPGIPLTAAVVEGKAFKAEDLVTLLSEENSRRALGPETVLVLRTLEPSWAVIFPRVKGVVAELGGELSHASILLREAGRPAITNCAGIFAAVRTGDILRLDGKRGLVEWVS